ncbi:ABC transporter permease subunit [Microbacterium sp.]|uniref:ABC transporter permease subunit n=1 Tax=Microbacterium sp. TaxID=51671 RepID=UPI003C773B44
MTTALSPAPTDSRQLRADGRSERLSFGRVLRSELIKLTTLRSTWWSLGVTVALAVGIALLIASASRSFQGDYPAVAVIVSPMQFTMLVAGIFGAMAVTGEYSTGMIRSTLTAEPRRGAVLIAKALTVALLLIATTVVSSLIAILATAPILGEHGIDWADAEASLVPLAYSLVAMASFGLLGLGFGFVIRNGAGAIAATVGVLFVLPIVLSLFAIGGDSWQWVVDLGQYLPMSAAQVLTTPASAQSDPDVGTAIVSLLAWPAATLVAGWLILRTRDA